MTSTFNFDKPEESLGFLLQQTTITWQRLIKKELDHFKLSHAQFVILAITLWLNSKNRESSQALVVKLSKLDKMTVSKSLKKLAKLGLIKRFECQIDTCVKKIELTKKGTELATKFVPIIENVDNNFFGRLVYEA